MHEPHMSIIGPRGGSLGSATGNLAVGVTGAGFVALHVRQEDGALGSLYLSPERAQELGNELSRWLPTAYGNRRREQEREAEIEARAQEIGGQS